MIFKWFYDVGLIYWVEWLVNWLLVLQIVIFDFEVNYCDVEGELVLFRYGLFDDL